MAALTGRAAIIWRWTLANWMYAGGVTGVFLLAMLPLVTGVWKGALTATYLMLPVYMLHQVEEHAGDRFRIYVNNLIGGGREILTPFAVVIINVVGVWLVILACLYAVAFWASGFGLIAVYLVLVNALAHLAPAARLRAYNPGLATAAILFVPAGVWALIVISRTPGVGFGDQVMGLCAAILIHAAIIVHVKRRGARLPSFAKAP